MKLLNGKDLAGYIKERQARQVSSLGDVPKLAIIQTKDDSVINTYVSLKQAYGKDIGIEVEKHFVAPEDTISRINELNGDNSVHGMIVQLPLDDSLDQNEVLNAVAKEKDVDGLGTDSPFDPATPMAIMWLLSGYNVDLKGKKVVIVGKGPLVGAPLARIFDSSSVEYKTADKSTDDLSGLISAADVLVTATGQPNLIDKSMINPEMVVIDAGVAVASGKTTGDLHANVYELENITITPKKGGVGPLTVAALFENVIKSARN